MLCSRREIHAYFVCNHEYRHRKSGQCFVIVAASPPQGDAISPQVAPATDLASADMILEMGGVQAIASMAFELFRARPADMLAGPAMPVSPRQKGSCLGKLVPTFLRDPLKAQ
jgi:histidinol dehydrogenase